MKKKDLFPLLFAIGYLMLNIIFTSKVFSLSHDSILYFWEIVERYFVLHPHHLLFCPTMTLGSDLLTNLGFQSTQFAVNFINSIATSATLVIIYIILKNNLGLNLFTARTAVLLCAFSYAYWFYAINIETYQLPLVFVFALVYMITKRPLSTSNLILAAIFGGIAVLFHQLHALMGVVVVLYLALTGLKSNLTKIFIFSVVFNLVWLIGYAIALYILGYDTFDKVSYWFFLYHHEVNSWSGFGTSFFLKPFIGIIRSVVSIHGLLIEGELNSMLLRMFAEKDLHDDAFIVRNMGAFDFVLYISILLSLLASVIYVFSSQIVRIRRVFASNSRYLFFLIFMLVYAVFFVFWDPTNMEFWIPQSILFWICFAVLLGKITPKKRGVIIAVGTVVLLFFLNFRYTILPASQIENDLYYTEVSEAMQSLPKNSIIVYEIEWIAYKYYKIFSPFEFVIPDSLNSQIDDFTFEHYINDKNTQGITVAIKSLVLENQSDLDEKELSEHTKAMFGITEFFIFKPDTVGKQEYLKAN
jgi:hypothetical protein